MSFPDKTAARGAAAAAFVALALLVGARLAEGNSFGMGPGMMGPGMMGSSGQRVSAPEPINPAHARILRGYIHEQNLACLQCHAVEGTGFGPPFALIAENYASRADAVQLLAAHIADGFGRMPGGLASEAQAARLAKMIMELPEAEAPGSVGKGPQD